MHDTGIIIIEKLGERRVIDVTKVGKVVLHAVDVDIPEDFEIEGKKIIGVVDKDRRLQLMAHHTGTHVMFAACRRILGPHIW
jgi:alanyl-tRNA synthetase